MLQNKNKALYYCCVVLYYSDQLNKQRICTLKYQAINYIDRKSGEICQESVFGNASLRFMYQSLLGRTLWGLLFNSANLSDLLGRYYDSPRSKKAIAKLAATPGCNPENAEFDIDEYPTFNAFFTRRLKPSARIFDVDKTKISSPADGRLFVYSGLDGNSPIPVKGAQRTLADLCCTELPFEKAAVAVIRLAPIDYHRFHFPCACEQCSETHVVCGKYHSVNPVALVKRPDIYVENTRQISALTSETAGVFFYIEVGAFGVGSIIQTSSVGKHEKDEEKGYFKFGGSTVILIFDDNKVKWDADLLKNTADGYETLIRQGESVAEISTQ